MQLPVFVAKNAAGAAIGMRSVLSEWAGLRGGMLNGICLALCGFLLVMGGRAVMAVTMT